MKIQMNTLYIILLLEIGILIGMFLIIPIIYISPKCRYDVNRDGKINIVDMVVLGNYIKEN